jgi:integrase
VSDPRTGLYPVRTRHSREVACALVHAARIWGKELPWDVVDRARLRMLGRTRVDEIRAQSARAGYRGAEVVVQRVLTVASWLRDEGKIASDACLVPRRWKDDLRDYWRQVSKQSTPEPLRPRHTLKEMRKIIAAAPAVDPRLALLLAFGAELRLGQVRRCRRTDLSVEHKTLTVRGAGKKKGTVVMLTSGQWAAWERATTEGGYLSRLERELPDYPLFPRGQLPGGRKGRGVAEPDRHGAADPIEDTAIRKWFRDAEDEAGVQHVNGRGAYGLRRIAVDAAKALGISREGLQAHGGWTDSQVPDSIYADQEMTYARAEAARIHAKIRGEVPPDTPRSAPEGVPHAYPTAKAAHHEGYAAIAQRTSSERVATMGLGGVEPPTSRLSGEVWPAPITTTNRFSL